LILALPLKRVDVVLISTIGYNSRNRAILSKIVKRNIIIT